MTCSPWSAAFPPQPPPAVARFCSAASPVLCRCTTPRRRASRTYGSSPSPPGPHTTCGRRRGLPVLAHGVSLHAWGLRLRGAAPRSRYRECALLPSVRADAVASPKPLISELNTQPTDSPVQRFKCDVTAPLTCLGARVAPSALSVRPFHCRLPTRFYTAYP